MLKKIIVLFAIVMLAQATIVVQLDQDLVNEELIIKGKLDNILGRNKNTWSPMTPEPVDCVDCDETVPLYVHQAFASFKTKFNRVYEGEEHEYRLSIFHDNLKFIEEFNMKEQDISDIRVGITEFADLTHEEFKMMYVGEKMTIKPESERNVIELDESNLADAVDWRTKGAVTPVKNQEQCGSCWAFSAVAAMEGAYFQKNGNLKSFSEQQLVDCSKKEGNHGCQGGLMDYAFKYAESSMMEQESDYKYKAKNGACEYSASKGVFNTKAYGDVRKDSVTQLAASVMAHVTSVAIEADKKVFQHYKSGVLDSRMCGKKLDHGVTAVGYTADAWIVKNSWGASWGDNGYVMIAKNDEDVCGIMMQPSYPTL